MNDSSQYLPRSDIGNKVNSMVLFLSDNPLDPGLESFSTHPYIPPTQLQFHLYPGWLNQWLNWQLQLPL